jgi:hypothetical protein
MFPLDVESKALLCKEVNQITQMWPGGGEAGRPGGREARHESQGKAEAVMCGAGPD